MAKSIKYSGTSIAAEWKDARREIEEFMRDVRNALAGNISVEENLGWKVLDLKGITNGQFPIIVEWGPLPPTAIFMTMARIPPEASGTIIYAQAYPDWRYENGTIVIRGISGAVAAGRDYKMLIVR